MPSTPAAPAGSRSAMTGRRRLVLGLCVLGAGLAAVVAAAAAPDEGGAWRTRDLLLLDFITSPRSAPAALAAVLGRLA